MCEMILKKTKNVYLKKNVIYISRVVKNVLT